MEPQKADDKAEGGLPFACLDRAQSINKRPEGTLDGFTNELVFLFFAIITFAASFF